MPTESTFLLTGLLFLAAALGYFFARFGDSEEDQLSDPSPIKADYMKGINFLLNEQPDQALEVFMRMVEVDDETLETHFALGSLFRRRGEFERAIRVHQNIIARPNLSEIHRSQAVISLADDYLSAGLFDRAEALFQQLAESNEHKIYAIEKLIYIYESTHDWGKAIELFQNLGKSNKTDANIDRAAHYFCELAHVKLSKKEFNRAREILRKALTINPKAVRPKLLLADIDRLENKFKAACKSYSEILESQPKFIIEVVPRLAASCRELGDQSYLSNVLNKLSPQNPSFQKLIALAVAHDKEIDNESALECLRNYVVSDKSLSHLVNKETLESGDASVRYSALQRVREGLRLLISKASLYRCRVCGYSSSSLIWQCPGCRNWDAVEPADDK
ncbi:MAG: lipopolysaccharide assembly protein LapB [Pseudomonadota bacterium]|nr:lipopolysaccharide assembly protein LapB [Pseudomonadota bacterium]